MLLGSAAAVVVVVVVVVVVLVLGPVTDLATTVLVLTSPLLAVHRVITPKQINSKTVRW